MHTHCGTCAKFIALCAIFLAAGCSSGGKIEEYSQSFSIDGRATVHVRAADAQVNVVTSDEPKVDFKVQYEKRDGSDSAFPVSSHQDGNAIELTANEDLQSWWSWSRFNTHQVIISVRMPKNADLQLQTSNGAIAVSALTGNIVLHSSNGAIRAGQLTGTIEVSTSNGAITLTQLTGSLKVHTSNGRIEAAGKFEALDVHSSNGGVVVRAESGSRVASGWSIGTSNAGIDLSVPNDLKANLDARTSNGGVILNVPVTVQDQDGSTHLQGILNGGGPEVSLRTSNGGIHVAGL